MVALCRKLYEDGCFGMSSSKEMAAFTGLSAYQIARGMTELREKGFIVPLIVKDADGRRRPDRSSSGHVARYCVARSIWETVELCGGGERIARGSLCESGVSRDRVYETIGSRGIKVRASF